MKKLDISTVPETSKPHTILDGLPDSLKDPARFKDVEKQLMLVSLTSHKHKTASSYVKCEECQVKYKERKQLMKDLGFKNTGQYMEWKKIMLIIINKQSFQVK